MGLIAKTAIQDYLNRPLDDWDWIKELPEEKLDELLAELSPRPSFKFKPMKHQKAAFLLGAAHRKFMFLLRMGTGKTAIGLSVIEYRNRKLGEISRTLVLVPYVANIYSWVREVKKMTPDLKAVPLYGSTRERIELIKDNPDGDLFIIPYQGFLKLAKTAGADWVADQFDSAILDEVHKLKNHKTQIFKLCSNLSKHSWKVRYGLTGTPFGRDPHDLWAQFYVVDHGETFGRTLSLFRAAFFTQSINYWGGYEYQFDKRKKSRLRRMMRHRSIYYSEDECSDLPDRVFRRVEVQFERSAKSYYKKTLEKLIESAKSKSTSLLDNNFIKLRQITSGFIRLKDMETGQVHQIDFPENPKLDALMSLIEGIPEDAKLVVFHEFIHSGDLIVERLKKEKIGYARLGGKVKDKVGQVRKFMEDPDCRVFVVNSESGSTGLNELVAANYCVFYESPVSPIVRDQAEKRIHRTGQKAKRCYYYDIVMKGSVDERILGFIKEGRDLYAEIVAGKVRVEDVL